MSVGRRFLRGVAHVVSVPAYYSYAATARLVNLSRARRPLAREVVAVLAHYFPHLDLSSVRVVYPARIPSAQKTTSGLTMGSTIYMKREPALSDERGMRLLLHELVHVDQGRRFGRTGFAHRYGLGYASAWSYRDNPLEQEAFAFERQHRVDLVDRLGRK
jgi:Domain of unknown function (DUF4157)